MMKLTKNDFHKNMNFINFGEIAKFGGIHYFGGQKRCVATTLPAWGGKVLFYVHFTFSAKRGRPNRGNPCIPRTRILVIKKVTFLIGKLLFNTKNP